MRVYFIPFALFLIFEATLQLPQNGGRTLEPMAATTKNVNVTTEAPVNCKTVGNISGICVIRANCNYGPGGIDYTLYSPSWYKRPCGVGEACCPFKYLIDETQSTNVVNSFEFDDDD